MTTTYTYVPNTDTPTAASLRFAAEARQRGNQERDCPRCGMPCLLLPLRRGGSYRLVDPLDGTSHAHICLGRRPS